MCFVYENYAAQLKTMYPIMQHVCTKLTSHVHDELAKQSNGIDAKEVIPTNETLELRFF